MAEEKNVLKAGTAPLWGRSVEVADIVDNLQEIAEMVR